jgi:hypothetical protein
LLLTLIIPVIKISRWKHLKLNLKQILSLIKRVRLDILGD